MNKRDLHKLYRTLDATDAVQRYETYIKPTGYPRWPYTYGVTVYWSDHQRRFDSLEEWDEYQQRRVHV